MKERLFLSADGRVRVEVCDCENVLQVRLFGADVLTLAGFSRVRIVRADIDRLADFFNDLLVDLEDLEERQANPEEWEALAPPKERRR